MHRSRYSGTVGRRATLPSPPRERTETTGGPPPSRHGNEMRSRPASPLSLTSQKKRLKPTADGIGNNSVRAALPPHLVHSSGIPDVTTTSGPPATRPPPPSPSTPVVLSNQCPEDTGGILIVTKGKTVETTTTPCNDKEEEAYARTALMAHDVAVAKLRLYLAKHMLQAVRSSPNGGFGVPVGYVIEAMGKEFGGDTVSDLLGSSSPNALILNKCGDIVDLLPLRVQDLTKNGCVPSIQFRRDSANMEAKIQKESLEIIVEVEAKMKEMRNKKVSLQKETELDVHEEENTEENLTLPESRHQSPIVSEQSASNASQGTTMLTEKKLREMVTVLLEEMTTDVLTDAVAFPSIPQFSEKFQKKHGLELDPTVAGYASVLDMLRGMQLDNLIRFSEFRGTVYLVPANQAYNKHFKEITDPKSQTPEEISLGGQATAVPERRTLSLPSALPTTSVPTLHAQSPLDIPPPPPPVEERVYPVSTAAIAGHLESAYIPSGVRTEVQEVPVLSPGEAYMASSRQGRFSQPSAIHVDAFDEFDAEILNKLKLLFEQTICRDHNPVCLNRLPLLFMRHCGSVLDYQKYGYINLTDVVCLLSDIVKVVDTANGKYIVPVDKPFRKASVLNSAMAAAAVPQRQTLEEDTQLVTSPTGAAIRMTEAPPWTTPSSVIDSTVWPSRGYSSVLPDRLGYSPAVMPFPPLPPPLPTHLPYFTGKDATFGSVTQQQQEQTLFRSHFSA